MADAVQLKVHRCRFVDYTPSPVTALAFPPLPLPNPKGKKAATGQSARFGTLVVGHSNGNIDVCEWTGRDEQQTQSPQAWVVRKTIVGTYPSKVDSLALVIRHPDLLEDDHVPCISDLRLFSSGGGNELVEWDPNRGCIRRTINSQGGAIWSIAANPSSSQLALACEDGTVRILSLAHDTLTHLRRFDRVKARILSLAWGPPIPRKAAMAKKAAKPPADSDDSSDDSSDDEDEDAWSDSWLVTGCSDSSLRKWDAKTGRVVDRMGVDKLRNERTLVWTVGVLGDGTIISGDSLGIVKFWDARTCTQLQSFRAHGADVLCHAIGPDGTTVFTSGVDQKVAQFTLVRASAPGADAAVQSQWVQARARRLHSHDVRALAIWPPHVCLPPALRRPAPSGIAPVLASGGLDMNVVLTPAAAASATIAKVVNPLATSVDATFEEAYQRRLAYPASAAVRVAPHARLVACMRDAALTLWRILKQDVPTDEAPATDGADNWEKVLEMELNVDTNLLAHAVSSDGRWLAVSDLYETKLFRLQPGEKGALAPRRVRDFAGTLAGHLPPAHGSTGALALAFTPDSSKLVLSAALGSYVLVVDLGGEDGAPRVLRRFDHHVSRTYALRDAVKRQGAEGDVEMADGDEDSGIELPAASSSAVPAVQRLAVSPDGQWLATSDDHAQTHIFNLDAIHHHCTLPSFGRPAQAIAFDTAQPALLLLAFPDNTLEFYDVEARAFPAWAQDLAAHLPRRLAGAHDPVLGVAFPPPAAGAPHYALLWGSTWLAKLDLGAARPRVRRKRRREATQDARAPEGGEEEDERRERDFRMVTHYRPVLQVDFLDSGELVVVERPLVDVLALLPPAYYKSKYGAS
ncbi:WD40-repeat-containing domain protein [Schizophyllum fasciatum]